MYVLHTHNKHYGHICTAFTMNAHVYTLKHTCTYICMYICTTHTDKGTTHTDKDTNTQSQTHTHTHVHAHIHINNY